MYIKQLFIGVCLSSLVACATPKSGDPESASEGSSRVTNCILEGTVRDYRVLNDSNLVVTAAGSRKYHIELTRPAFRLKSTWQIGFLPSGSRICAGFSELVIKDSFDSDRVRIKRIVRLNKDDYEELMIRFGLMEPEIEQAREPEEVEGAELEELD